MPEGPSIVILRELVQPFEGKKVTDASGTLTAFDPKMLEGKKIVSVRSWGKHLLISFKDMTVRIHLLMFGTYRINERKDAKPRLSMQFAGKKELNFYTCSVRLIEQPLDEVYDWAADIMNPAWNSRKALKKLRAKPEMLACDALLDQDIFAGSGNIIKNEVLFRVKIHPASRMKAIPAEKLRLMVKETVQYGQDFLKWKKEFTLKKHWLAHTKKICPRDGTAIVKVPMGKGNRRTFYCPECQVLYD